VPEQTLTLTQAKKLRDQPFEEGFRIPFSLLFEGPAPMLPQRTYLFDNAGMGQREIFIVPIAKAGEGFRYEAIFN
jgi:hypothetical protein